VPDRVYIAIEGPIGVGKTTLARMLQPEFDAELVLEIFEENPFLSDFYADRARFAFQTQIFFLLSRYRQQREVQRLAQHHSLITDYTFAKDRLFAHLNLHGDELETYERLHQALAERVTAPDLVVYLRASPDVLMERIATRDRPYERGISRDYIVDLSRAYDQFFATFQGARLLVLDTDCLNVVRNPSDLQDVCTRIRAALANGPRPGLPPLLAPPPAAEAPVPHAASEPGANYGESLALCTRFLSLQQAVGELAGVLLLSLPAQGRPARSVRPDLARQALAACESALRELADCMGMSASLMSSWRVAQGAE